MKSAIRKLTTPLLFVAASLLAGCDAGPPPETRTMSAPSSSAASAAAPTAGQWQRVAQLRVLFAHQSVGGNILDGIQREAAARQVPLVLAESRSALPGAGIQHFKVGRNEDPAGKLADFESVVNGEAGTPPNVALLKFCYIDFTQRVDPQQLAQQYIAELDALSSAHPQTVFVPMTSPLTTVQTGPRAWLKKVLGKEPGGYADNVRRQAFNAVVRSRYGSDPRLFDIAALESGGGRHNVDAGGTRVEFLDPALTDDGGHLNEAGQRLVGNALIAHLATVGKP